MKKIYKYKLASNSRVTVVPMPIGAKVLSAINQKEEVVIFAEVETTVPDENRTFRSFSTGEELAVPGYDLTFVGTVPLRGTTYPLHIYEMTLQVPTAADTTTV